MNYISTNVKINLEWAVKKGIGNEAEDFSRSTVSLFLISDINKWPLPCTADYSGVVKAEIPETLPEGAYSLELIWYKNDTNLRCLQRTRKVCVFVVDAATPVSGLPTIKMSTVAAPYGYDGLSAYEIAVLRGATSLDEYTWSLGLFNDELANALEQNQQDIATERGRAIGIEEELALRIAANAEQIATKQDALKFYSEDLTEVLINPEYQTTIAANGTPQIQVNDTETIISAPTLILPENTLINGKNILPSYYKEDTDLYSAGIEDVEVVSLAASYDSKSTSLEMDATTAEVSLASKDGYIEAMVSLDAGHATLTAGAEGDDKAGVYVDGTSQDGQVTVQDRHGANKILIGDIGGGNSGVKVEAYSYVLPDKDRVYLGTENLGTLLNNLQAQINELKS